ncbi:hypothetical protein M513_01682 [Trichuris suis]|uniref:Uncharacterized protein n=1 Tax=Trichuris suis TaxID=68888 RepID=A0A085MK33_9BILA|nr:hypothetical protein M513_01682 [Trichuris suis]
MLCWPTPNVLRTYGYTCYYEKISVSSYRVAFQNDCWLAMEHDRRAVGRITDKTQMDIVTCRLILELDKIAISAAHELLAAIGLFLITKLDKLRRKAKHRVTSPDSSRAGAPSFWLTCKVRPFRVKYGEQLGKRIEPLSLLQSLDHSGTVRMYVRKALS